MCLRNFAALSALLGLLFLVGHLDYQDAQEEDAYYCEMVKARLWPDYRGTYRKECAKRLLVAPASPEGKEVGG